MTEGLAAYFAALAAALLVAWRLARARRFPLDPPGERKLQPWPVPLVGGSAILAGTAIGWWLAESLSGRDPRHAFEHGRWRVLVPALGGFLVGLYDDAKGKRLSAAMKALGTVAVLLVARPVGEPTASWLAWLPIAFVALHATNTVDHAHGLAGFVALIGGIAVAASVALGSRPPDSTSHAALAVAGASAGFLFLNFPRGRVFLGDSGTLMLGGWLAALLLHSRRPELLLLAAVPIADLASVSLLRLRLGARPWVGDRRHVTHRLTARGGSEARAVLQLAAVQAACSTLAAWMLADRRAPAAAWGTTLGVIAALAVGMLWLAPHRPVGAARAAPPA
jgi:UDP-N-acetylmuramyl pentapeptide phosphotransferase/UDP-N-acetylglucosamine-1-phosphate transferase